ncbi:MAG: hypothetical protein AAF739_01455 [Pseudomonadota bacterium]
MDVKKIGSIDACKINPSDAQNIKLIIEEFEKEQGIDRVATAQIVDVGKSTIGLITHSDGSRTTLKTLSKLLVSIYDNTNDASIKGEIATLYKKFIVDRVGSDDVSVETEDQPSEDAKAISTPGIQFTGQFVHADVDIELVDESPQPIADEIVVADDDVSEPRSGPVGWLSPNLEALADAANQRPVWLIALSLLAVSVVAVFSTFDSADEEAGLFAQFAGWNAQSAYEPRRGSDERAVLMDAVRPQAVRDLGAPVEFYVIRLAVFGDIAHASLRAQRPGGVQINMMQTPRAGMPDFQPSSEFPTIEALLRREGEQWRVVEYAFSTDASVFASPELCTMWRDVLPSRNCKQP